MIVDHPLQQRLALAANQRVGAFRAVLEQRAGLPHALAHFSPVTYRDADIGQYSVDVPAKLAQRLVVGLA